MLVTEGRYKGYDDAGIYVGGINNPQTVVSGHRERPPRRTTAASSSRTRRATRGSWSRTTRRTPTTNGFTPSGIFLHNADGVVISGNSSDQNPYAGIHLDVTSDDNRVLDNTASGNGVGAQGGEGADLQNEGAGNCGHGNVFGTVGGNPLGAC